MSKALVVLSGGQDSVTCLGVALKGYAEVEAISFYYNQKHDIELECAEKICQQYNVPHKVVEVDFLSDLVTTNLVKGTESVNNTHPDNEELPASFVPNRNALFLTLAHGHAQKIGASKIVTGVCQTDYSGYPDCREIFILAQQEALNLGAETNIDIVTPLMYLTKAQTFALAESVDFLGTVLNDSHTCYNGNREKAHEWGYGCGECPACEVRKNGYFQYLREKATENGKFIGARICLENEVQSFIKQNLGPITPDMWVDFFEEHKQLIGDL